MENSIEKAVIDGVEVKAAAIEAVSIDSLHDDSSSLELADVITAIDKASRLEITSMASGFGGLKSAIEAAFRKSAAPKERANSGNIAPKEGGKLPKVREKKKNNKAEPEKSAISEALGTDDADKTHKNGSITQNYSNSIAGGERSNTVSSTVSSQSDSTNTVKVEPKKSPKPNNRQLEIVEVEAEPVQPVKAAQVKPEPAASEVANTQVIASATPVQRNTDSHDQISTSANQSLIDSETIAKFTKDSNGRLRNEKGAYASKVEQKQYEKAKSNSESTGQDPNAKKEPEKQTSLLKQLVLSSARIAFNGANKGLGDNGLGDRDSIIKNSAGLAIGGSYFIAAQEAATVLNEVKTKLKDSGINSFGDAVKKLKDTASNAQDKVVGMGKKTASFVRAVQVRVVGKKEAEEAAKVNEEKKAGTDKVKGVLPKWLKSKYNPLSKIASKFKRSKADINQVANGKPSDKVKAVIPKSLKSKSNPISKLFSKFKIAKRVINKETNNQQSTDSKTTNKVTNVGAQGKFSAPKFITKLFSRLASKRPADTALPSANGKEAESQPQASATAQQASGGTGTNSDLANTETTNNVANSSATTSKAAPAWIKSGTNPLFKFMSKLVPKPTKVDEAMLSAQKDAAKAAEQQHAEKIIALGDIKDAVSNSKGNGNGGGGFLSDAMDFLGDRHKKRKGRNAKRGRSGRFSRGITGTPSLPSSGGRSEPPARTRSMPSGGRAASSSGGMPDLPSRTRPAPSLARGSAFGTAGTSIPSVAAAGGGKMAAAGGMMGKAARLGGTALSKLALPLTLAMAAYDGVSGYNDSEGQKETFKLKDGEEASTGQKLAMGAGSVLSLGGLTDMVGISGTDISKGIYKAFGGEIEGESNPSAMITAPLSMLAESVKSMTSFADTAALKETFGVAEGEDVSLGQRASAIAGSALSMGGLTKLIFGESSSDLSKSIYSLFGGSTESDSSIVNKSESNSASNTVTGASNSSSSSLEKSSATNTNTSKVSSSVTNAASGAVVGAVANAVTETVTETAAETAAKTVAKTDSNTVTETTSNAVAKPVTETVSNTVAKPVAETVSNTVTKSATETVAQSQPDALTSPAIELVSNAANGAVPQAVAPTAISPTASASSSAISASEAANVDAIMSGSVKPKDIAQPQAVAVPQALALQVPTPNYVEDIEQVESVNKMKQDSKHRNSDRDNQSKSANTQLISKTDPELLKILKSIDKKLDNGSPAARPQQTYRAGATPPRNSGGSIPSDFSNADYRKQANNVG